MAIKDTNGKEWKVVVVTPAGRERYLSILHKYIERDMKLGLVDGWQLWKNTNIPSDLTFMRHICSENPKIELKEIAGVSHYEMHHIRNFFVFTQDEDTLYIRLDDDIVFIDEYALQLLLEVRLREPNWFLVFPMIINNSICTHLYQRHAIIGTEKGIVGYNCMDEVGWLTPTFTEYLHRSFQSKLDNPNLLLLDDWVLFNYEHISVNAFCFFGKDFKKFGGVIPQADEERWLTEVKPKELGRPNLVFGGSVVAHYAYHTQRTYLDTVPDIYEFYRNRADKI